MRRGQVALEFLTTYGWAILVLLIMVGAISYFGVMNPSKLLPSRCLSGTELSCADYQILEDGTVSLQLKQGVGKTIYLGDSTCEYGDALPVTIPNTDKPWAPKDTILLTCDVGDFNGLRGQKVKVLFDIKYKQSVSGFEHLVSGELYTEVQ